MQLEDLQQHDKALQQPPQDAVPSAQPALIHFDSSMTPTPQSQNEQLQNFWEKQKREINQQTVFKETKLPLSRIKRIMKSDEEVRMISTEAPLLFAKACELFIVELTLRAWFNTDEGKRKTLQRNDIAMAITRTDVYDFLIDIVPQEEMKVGKKPDEPMRPGMPMGGEYFHGHPSLPVHPNLQQTYPMTAPPAEEDHMMGRGQGAPGTMDPSVMFYDQNNPAGFRPMHQHVMHFPHMHPQSAEHHQAQMETGHEFYQQPPTGQEYAEQATPSQHEFFMNHGQ